MNTYQNQQLNNQDGNHKLTYEQLGKEHARNANGNPNQLPNSLNIIYNDIKKNSIYTESQKQNILLNLSTELNKLNNEKLDLNALVLQNTSDIKSNKKEIDDIEVGKGHIETAPFLISTSITILLTLFLWTFYAAAGYAALNGVKPGVSGFKAVWLALEDMYLGSGILRAAVILFPAIFVGLGFLIHDSLEKKKFKMIYFLITFTFLFDAIIGYVISSEVYFNRYANGEVSLPWNWTMIFYSFDFYLILASGFVSYLMWGFLLNSTLTKHKELQPTVKQNILNKKNTELEKQNLKINNDIEQINLKIKNNKLEIDQLNRSVIFINISDLKAKIGYFMSGWGQYINMMIQRDAENLLLEANNIAEKWLQDKLTKNNDGNVKLKD